MRSRPAAAFIIYQVTNELRQHATHFDQRRVRVFSAKHSADVHHGISQSEHAERPQPSRGAGGAGASQSARMSSGGCRTEKDSMGEMSVPESALYGASTQRAVLNFPVSGYRFSRPFIRALGLVEMGRRAGESRSRIARRASFRAHRAGGGRSDRGQARRAFPARYFPDRFGHEHEHERERSDRASFAAVGGREGRSEAIASIRTITSTWASRATT